MIAEDEVHAKAGSTNLSSLSVDDRVRELIYRLRDQNGHQMIYPGRCDICCEWGGTTNSPVHQLVRLGTPMPGGGTMDAVAWQLVRSAIAKKGVGNDDESAQKDNQN